METLFCRGIPHYLKPPYRDEKSFTFRGDKGRANGLFFFFNGNFKMMRVIVNRTDLEPIWNNFSVMINDVVKASIQQYEIVQALVQHCGGLLLLVKSCVLMNVKLYTNRGRSWLEYYLLLVVCLCADFIISEKERLIN